MTRNPIILAVAAGGALFLAGCASTPVADHCAEPLHHQLEIAIDEAGNRLEGGCALHFDSYFTALLDRARDQPDTAHRRAFSDFLVRAADAGVVSQRQAKALYNRYFNVRFVSLSGDFNTCSQVCPDQDAVLGAMNRELADKEVGLLQISDDAAAYYRADNLLKQSQLVLAATCDACAAAP